MLATTKPVHVKMQSPTILRAFALLMIIATLTGVARGSAIGRDEIAVAARPDPVPPPVSAADLSREGAGADVTFLALLQEMIDRTALARLPDHPYRCIQFSSYDRGSTSADDPDTWFANWDRSQFVRVDDRDRSNPARVRTRDHASVAGAPVPEGVRREYVLADATGAGAVVRMWATWHGVRGREPFSDGTLRIYLDDDFETGEARFAGPASEMIGGQALCGPPLSQSVAPQVNPAWRGRNLYLPIPFADRCVITYETDALMDIGARDGEALYYQINVRQYESGRTRVETLTPEILERDHELVERVQRYLRSGGRPAGDTPALSLTGTRVQEGDRTRVALLNRGPGAITELMMVLEADDLEQALRSMLVEMIFDGKRTVRAPIGDFFGIGHRVNPSSTWHTEVEPAAGERANRITLRSFWVMPFETSAAIEFHNVRTDSRSRDGRVAIREVWYRAEPRGWDADRDMHFHARWTGNFDLDTRALRPGSDDPGPTDVRYADLVGPGALVGDVLTIFNRYPGWWGEGDEKIYVDGETFPSHFGTGTEDYYGYAWCRPEEFNAPFHAQPDGSGNLEGGYAVNLRWRALDAIPFDERLIFDMELWHHRETTVDFCPTVFWYARPEAPELPSREDDAALVNAAARDVPRNREGVWKPEAKKVDGAIEAEELSIIARPTTGEVTVQDVAAFGFSGGKQVWWIDGEPGDHLTLRLPLPPIDAGGSEVTVEAAEAHRYRLVGGLTRANDYAVLQFAVDGSPSPANPVDCYNPEVIVREVDLGQFTRRPGAAHCDVRITIAGRNDKAIPRHMAGIDYLRVEEVTSLP